MPRGRSRTGDSVLVKSAEMLGWALGGLEREIMQTRERLATLSAQAKRLRARAVATAPAFRGPAAAASFQEPAGTGRKRRRRKMSAEARKRISDRMTKLWAERRKAKAKA